MRSFLHTQSTAFNLCATILVLVLICAGCSGNKSAGNERHRRIPVRHTTGTFQVTVPAKGLIECVNEDVATVPPKFHGRLEYIIAEGEQVQPGDLLFKLSKERLEQSARQFQLQADRQKIQYEKAKVKNHQAQADRVEELNVSLIKLQNAKDKQEFFAKGNDVLQIDKFNLELSSTDLSIKHLSNRLSTQKALATKGYSSQLELLRTEDSYEQSVLKNQRAMESLKRIKEGKTSQEQQQLEKTTQRFTISSNELKERNIRQTSIDTLSEEREKLRVESLQAAAKKRFDILKSAEVTAKSSGTAIHMNLSNWGINKLQTGTRVWRGMNLVKVSDTSLLKASLKVSSGDVEHIRPGQKAFLSFPAIPNLRCNGKVTKVGKVAVADKWSNNDGVKLFDVSIELTDPSPLLAPNISVKAEILVTSTDNATKVPSAAVYKRDGTECMDIIDNQRESSQPVEIIVKNRGFTFIKPPIKKDARVLLPQSGGNS